MKREKILWIEDEAAYGLDEMRAYVDYEGKYDLDLACDATTAEQKMLQYDYSAIIVDLRIPAGTNVKWAHFYEKRNNDTVEAKLGLELLRSLFGKPKKDQNVIITNIPSRITRSIFGVFSVETKNHIDELKTLGIQENACIQKSWASQCSSLSDLIDIIVNNKAILKKEGVS